MADPFSAYANLGSAPPASSGGPYTHDKLKSLWLKEGGPEQGADIMGHVMLNESAGDQTQVNKGSGASGLAQILPSAHPEFKGWNLLDPVQNVRAAIRLYKESGLKPWEDSRLKGAFGGWGQNIVQAADAAETPKKDPFAAYAKPDPFAGYTAPPKAPPANPFDTVDTKARHQLESGVGKVLNTQLDAALQAHYHGGSEDENMKRLRTSLGVEQDYENPKLFGVVPQPGWATQAERGVLDTALKMEHDPLTIETLGFTPVARMVAPLLPALNAMRLVNATPLGAMLYDTFHWGGPIAREQGPQAVAKLQGTMNMAGATGRVVQQHLVSRFGKITQGLTDEEKVRVGKALNGEGLVPGEEGAATAPGDALTPKEASAYRQLRTLTELDYKMRTDAARAVVFQATTRDLPQADRDALQQAFRSGKEPEIPKPGARVRQPYVGKSSTQKTTYQPANAAEITHATDLNKRYHDIAFAVEQGVPKREHYMPWAHTGEAAPAEGRAARTFDSSEHLDPHTLQRDDIHITKPEQLQSGFDAMARNTGRQVQTGIVHQSLGELLDHPEVKKLFEQVAKATGNERTNVEKFKDAWLGIVGYPRAATVSLTPRHAANILDLAANTVPLERQPQFFKDTMALAARLANPRITPAQYRALTKEGRDLGALSGEYAERKPFFQGVPVLKNWTALNNRLVWAVDEAAKQTYAKMITASGEASGLEAGGLAARRLVDYSHVSPFVKALRYVAPFGTFRGSIPGAVLGGIGRNPMRAAALNRATAGTMYGGEPPKGGHGTTLYNPTADVSRGLENPGEYVRGTLGAPAQAAAVLASEVLSGRPGASLKDTAHEVQQLPGLAKHGQWKAMGKPGWSPYANAVALRTARYLNYGNAIDLRWLTGAAAAGVPEAQEAIEHLGYGQFRPQQGDATQQVGTEALRQALGIGVR